MQRRYKEEQIRFRGICLNGRLKGKEIEGFVNIDAVNSVDHYREPSSWWSAIVLILLLLIGVNLMAERATQSLTPAIYPGQDTAPLSQPIYFENRE